MLHFFTKTTVGFIGGCRKLCMYMPGKSIETMQCSPKMNSWYERLGNTSL